MTTENPNAANSTAATRNAATKPSRKANVKTPLKPATMAPELAKAATKPVAKPAAKPAAISKTTANAKAAAQPAVKVSLAEAVKTKKPKMVRDSFTFPKAEYAVLEALKLRAAKLGSPAKKTELLRAGVKAIAAMQDGAFVAALKVVPSLKTGRPAKAKAN